MMANDASLKAGPAAPGELLAKDAGLKAGSG
jgi:hypothetical protein